MAKPSKSKNDKTKQSKDTVLSPFNQQLLDDMIVNERDYLFDFFGLKTLERSYLFKINDKIVERPQYMWLRVSL